MILGDRSLMTMLKSDAEARRMLRSLLKMLKPPKVSDAEI